MQVLDRLASCACCPWTGKLRYKDRHTAKRNGKLIGGRLRKRYKAYRCPFCESFHLTTRTPFTQGV